jgi:hypothetical protein
MWSSGQKQKEDGACALRRCGTQRTRGELRQLREENRKLKALMTDPTLDTHILQEVLSKKWRRWLKSIAGTPAVTASRGIE